MFFFISYIFSKTLKPFFNTCSSDAQIIRGQNLPSRNRKNNNRQDVLSDTAKNYRDSAKGEVILQPRFNPRPWIAYESVASGPPKNINSSPQAQPQNIKSQEINVPFDSFPLSYKPPGENNPNPPPKNTYGSPFSSYNPRPTFRTPNFVTPSQYLPPDVVVKPPKFESNSDDYINSPTPTERIKMPTKYLPPELEIPFKPPNNQYPPPELEKPFKPPNIQYLPSTVEKPPENDVDQENDSGPPLTKIVAHPGDSDEHDSYFDSTGPPNIKHPSNLPAYLDHDPNLNPHAFKHYIYDHPVYHEIKTTTEAPMDQRLNKRPYSYYYLGRKLWYIPLYFSVYFIIYIFVLILKSIARHKITFNQYFEEDKREMPKMPEDHMEELHHQVVNDIHAARRKYMM